MSTWKMCKVFDSYNFSCNLDQQYLIRYSFKHNASDLKDFNYVIGKFVRCPINLDTINVTCSRTGNKIISTKHDTFYQTCYKGLEN